MIDRLLHTLRLRQGGAFFSAILTPRKPRHPLMRLAMGLVGVAVLAVLLVFGVVIGAGMLAVGLVARALGRRRTPAARRHGTVIDAEFRVADKPALR